MISFPKQKQPIRKDQSQKPKTKLEKWKDDDGRDVLLEVIVAPSVEETKIDEAPESSKKEPEESLDEAMENLNN